MRIFQGCIAAPADYLVQNKSIDEIIYKISLFAISWQMRTLTLMTMRTNPLCNTGKISIAVNCNRFQYRHTFLKNRNTIILLFLNLFRNLQGAGFLI